MLCTHKTTILCQFGLIICHQFTNPYLNQFSSIFGGNCINSGVVSLRHLRLVIFLGELNNLELWGADIGNAYLEAYTHEKLFIIAGPEFEELEGFILIFNKALYGLKSSGKRWADRFYDIIKDMGFMPSKADPCIWMRENQKLKCYEYVATYLDDLCIAAQNPCKIIQTLKEDYKLKVKVMDP